MTRTEIEADAKFIVDSLQSNDYAIPETSEILKPIFKWLSIVYIIQVVGCLLDYMLHFSVWESYDTSDVAIMSSVSCVVVTLMVLIIFYGNVSLSLCISREVRDKSILCRMIKVKLKAYIMAITSINIVCAIILLLCGPAWIGALGASWFVTIMLSCVLFSYSMSRYTTPAVTATLSKIGEALSSPNK